MRQSPLSTMTAAAAPLSPESAAPSILLDKVHLTLEGPAGPVNILRGVDLSVAPGTALGVEAIVSAQREGLRLTASTPARNLLIDEEYLDDGRYDARFRLHPPLRSRADRAALVAAVQAGTLLLAADHQPRAPEEKDHEFERSVPGSPGLRTAFAAAMTALGSLDAVVAALSLAPRAVLGLDVCSWALVDPEGSWVVAGARPLATDALEGVRLRGVVYELISS